MIGLDEQQTNFIDFYLETFDPTSSAKRAGYDKAKANRIALNLLSTPLIQEAIEKRKQELKIIAKGMQFDKEDLIRVFWSMYTDCRNKGKIKEAKDILEDIARWNGVNPDQMKAELAVLKFNIDGNKI